MGRKTIDDKFGKGLQLAIITDDMTHKMLKMISGKAKTALLQRVRERFLAELHSCERDPIGYQPIIPIHKYEQDLPIEEFDNTAMEPMEGTDFTEDIERIRQELGLGDVPDSEDRDEYVEEAEAEAEPEPIEEPQTKRRKFV